MLWNLAGGLQLAAALAAHINFASEERHHAIPKFMPATSPIVHPNVQ
jgi:hypothetical protein